MDVQDLQKNSMDEKQDDEIECRACLDKLNSTVNLVSLFQAWTTPWEGMEKTIAEDLSKIGNIQVHTELQTLPAYSNCLLQCIIVFLALPVCELLIYCTLYVSKQGLVISN